MTALTIGDLNFEVRRSDRRRTLGLTVERDGSLVLLAPTQAADEQVERFARQKRFWVYQKLAAREARRRPLTDRKFVAGEGFPYLGRSYRLQLVSELDVPLKLEAGLFRMRRDPADQYRATMIGWYTTHACDWITGRVARYSARARVEPCAVVVRDLGFRWGSCGKGGRLYFHWQSILLPPSIVDYIVVHELIHLREPHHTPNFWRAVEQLMPDGQDRRCWLAAHGHEFVV